MQKSSPKGGQTVVEIVPHCNIKDHNKMGTVLPTLTNLRCLTFEVINISSTKRGQ